MRSTTLGWALNIVALCFTAYPVALQAADDSPYAIEKREFKKRIKSVALTPLYAPDIFKLDAATRAMIEAEATERMAKTKLKALPIATYAELRQTMADQIGGLASADGEVDAQREAIVWDHAKREMRMRHDVDGFAEISIRMVNAAFKADRAEWDGVKAKVKSSGGGNKYEGSIAAASFQLAIFDRNDNLLYSSRGGIEVMQERQGSRLFLRDGKFLQDEKRVKKAIREAFKEL